MTRRSVAAWLGASAVTEAQALEHCHKQSIGRKATKEFMKAFGSSKAKWEKKR